jgi:hypothetical protein
MKDHEVILAFPLLILSLFLLVCQDKKMEWKGTITTENGVTVVTNPEEPMYREDSLHLEEDLTIGQSSEGPDYMFSAIRSIAVDDEGNIFVLDRIENKVLAFDPMGKHLRTFGRKGQGPEELSYPVTVAATGKGEIIVEDSRRHLAIFSTEGKHLRNIPTTKSRVSRIAADESGNILGVVIIRDKGDPRYEIQKFDPEMNYLFSLDSTPTPSASNRGLNPFGGSVYFTFYGHSQIACAISGKYEINVYDADGNLVKKITKDFDPIEITDDEIQQEISQLPEIKLDIPKYHNPIRWMSADDEGRIFVMTMERIPGEEGYYHDVFDSEGRYIAKIHFRYRPHVIKNDKFYTVAEDEVGFHVVKRYNLTWRIGR